MSGKSVRVVRISQTRGVRVAVLRQAPATFGAFFTPESCFVPTFLFALEPPAARGLCRPLKKPLPKSPSSASSASLWVPHSGCRLGRRRGIGLSWYISLFTFVTSYPFLKLSLQIVLLASRTALFVPISLSPDVRDGAHYIAHHPRGYGPQLCQALLNLCWQASVTL